MDFSLAVLEKRLDAGRVRGRCGQVRGYRFSAPGQSEPDL